MRHGKVFSVIKIYVKTIYLFIYYLFNHNSLFCFLSKLFDIYRSWQMKVVSEAISASELVLSSSLSGCGQNVGKAMAYPIT